MKKIILLLCFFGIVFSQETFYGEVKGKTLNEIYGQFLDSSLKLSYDQDTESIGLYTKDILATTVYYFKKDEKDPLIEIIDKYLEWRLTAISNEVKIQKTIDITFNSLAGFTYGDELFGDRSANITGIFFSRDKKNHELVLSFDKLVSFSNEFIDHKPENVYLEYEKVLELKKLLSDEKISEVEIDIKKQKEIENLFN